MPRGLGDDPLSRQKKNGQDRPAASKAALLNSVTASNDTPSIQPFVREGLTSEALVSSQPSSSYNDVFFQRRLEDGLEYAPTMNNDMPSPGVADPVVQPTEMERVSVGTAPGGSLHPQSEEDAGPAKKPPTLGETLIVPEEGATTSQPKTEERGFFRRIFGRLGQQKSH